MDVHLHICLDMVTHPKAQDTCLSKGQSLWLPGSRAKLDGVYQKLFNRSIHSIWVLAKRAELTDYFWIDNKRHSKSNLNMSILIINKFIKLNLLRFFFVYGLSISPLFHSIHQL